MPAIKVDPPPVNMSIVDLRTGKPTRTFVEFMHRLWKRTGGEDDAVDNLDTSNAYPFFKTSTPQDPEDRQPSFMVQQTGAGQEAIDEAVNNLASLVAARAPQSDLIEAIETLRTVILVDMARSRSEIGELREQVQQLSKQVGNVDLRGVILPAQALGPNF